MSEITDALSRIANCNDLATAREYAREALESLSPSPSIKSPEAKTVSAKEWYYARYVKGSNDDNGVLDGWFKRMEEFASQFPATKEIVLPEEEIDLYKEVTDIFYHLVDRKDLSRADAEDMILKLFEVHGIKWRTEK